MKPQQFHSVSLKDATRYWLKLGLISFGGPAGQIAIMHHDLVEKKGWLTESQFLHALNYCMILPGPEAQQLATYIGWRLHRIPGALIAGSLFFLPAFFLLGLLAWGYLLFGNTPFIVDALMGIRPAVIAIIFSAGIKISKRTHEHPTLWILSLIALILSLYHIPFPAILCIVALIGLVANQIPLLAFLKRPATPIKNSPQWHPRTTLAWIIKTLLIGSILWGTVIGLLYLVLGWNHPLSQMAWFFTKAAIMTFGGAYAVLPYVFQGAVNHYHWLSVGQMLDGLALGETTPGPLIMVNTFVAFVGGWNTQALGIPALSGWIAACVTTFFTFLPSFVMVLMGAPIIQDTQNNTSLQVPLKAINAAVIGVIFNLGIFLSWHTFWPSDHANNLDWLSIGLFLLAGILLNLYKMNIVLVIISLGLIGMMIPHLG
jgi:chromate transporter